MNGRRATLRLAVAAAACAWSLAAQAASCTVSTTALAFGSYDPRSASATDSTASVTVRCDPGVVQLLQSYTVQLSAGGSGNQASRQLGSATASLAYQAYADIAHTLVLGDGNGGTTVLAGSFLVGIVLPVTATHTVYGRIAPLQTATPPGSYSDAPVLTVTY